MLTSFEAAADKLHEHISAVNHAQYTELREAARLQSFPDSFYFGGNMGNKFQMIGNAVPPLLAEEIGAAVIAQVFRRQSTSGHASVA